MTSLRIAPGLALDPDYVGGGTFALLAKKGAGKTYTGRVMAEEFWKAKVPFVVLDPMGAWWGLRSSADGAGEGIPVAIFGGEHGDAPLERGGGQVLADLVVEEGLSMVLDMKALGSRAAEREFAKAFLERLYRRNSELVHLFMDEADLFAPQKPQAGDQPLLGVTENIVRRGRNAGIGITLITQRPAVLNKDVLTQVDGLVAMRITGLTDRNAIDDWVKGHDDPELAAKVKPTLAGLANGECWWWIPELEVLKQVQVRKSETFDSSPTRRRGDKRREPKSFADIDMDAIQRTMADTIQRAKANDPKELRAEVARLRKQLAERPKEQVEKIEYVDVPVLEGAHIERLEDAVEALSGAASKIIAAANEVTAGLAKAKGRPAPAPQPVAQPARAPRAAPTPEQRPAAAADGDFNPSRPQLRLLNALATLEGIGVRAPTRVQAALFAETSPRSSGYEKNVSTLNTSGLIHYPAPGALALTDAGRTLANPVDAPSTVEEMHEYARILVKPAKAKLLDVLIAAYPDGITREELAERAGVSVRSSGFEKNVSGLSSLGLVTYPQRGYVAAQPVLFLEAA